jgi:flagellar biosynthesis GTPase FlhF
MNARKYFLRLPVLALILVVLLFSCKSKKQALQASNVAAEKAKLEQEAALRKIQQLEEEAKRKEAEEKARREAEAKSAETAKVSAPEQSRLNQYFETIANSGSTTSANSSIMEALAMFASPEAPVLIVISEYNGQKDYDRPTTIQNYLNYLKDQKKSNSVVSAVKTNSAGKITELELRKNF